MLKRLIVISLMLGCLTLAGIGCRTAHGFGEDMENAGHKLQDKTDQ